MSAPHVQLIVDRSVIPPPLQTALNRLHARVSIRSLDKALSSGVSPSADVCVILPGSAGSSDVLERLVQDASDQACATMILPGPGGPESSSSGGLEVRAVGAGRALGESSPSRMNADELTGRIKALCEIRHPLCRMRDELHRLRQRDAELTSDAHQFHQQLQVASQIQKDMLPAPLRNTGPLSIATLYLPADRVSGDIYDISRLDEERFSFSIADATGHGLPAALLTFLIKNSLRGKEIHNGSYRIIEPDELLERLNRDVLGTNLSQGQFITALHAIFDRSRGCIRWARGGVPYPILIRPGQAPRQVRSEGGLIGAFPGQSFEVVTRDVEPGDTLLFYTDGLEAFLTGQPGEGGEGHLLPSPWIDKLATDGAEAAFADVRRQVMNTSGEGWPKDDMTAIAITLN